MDGGTAGFTEATGITGGIIGRITGGITGRITGRNTGGICGGLNTGGGNGGGEAPVIRPGGAKLMIGESPETTFTTGTGRD